MPRKKKRNNNRALYVEVIDNNIELALKQLKQRVKDSNLMVELKEKAYYQKPSAKRRHVKNLAKLRTKYKKIEDDQSPF
jgi:small subunit ribosomal protein S21